MSHLFFIFFQDKMPFYIKRYMYNGKNIEITVLTPIFRFEKALLIKENVYLIGLFFPLQVLIRAEDKGTPSLSATGTLTVYVSVDPTLVWVTNDWTATITENRVVGNIVKTIQATPPVSQYYAADLYVKIFLENYSVISIHLYIILVFLTSFTIFVYKRNFIHSFYFF